VIRVLRALLVNKELQDHRVYKVNRVSKVLKVNKVLRD
jgi:hypothetical protein